MNSIKNGQYADDKTALLYVHSKETGNIHIAWNIYGFQDDDQFDYIVVFEVIPENYPSASYVICESMRDYKKAITGVSWINLENSSRYAEYLKPILIENGM